MATASVFGTNDIALARRRRLLAGASLAVMAASGAAHAYETTVGGYQVNIDTTLSSSVDLRLSPIDENFVGVPNGGSRRTVDPNSNEDNGTLNFRNGSPVAAVQRVTTEVQIKKDDYGLFIRATGFYDPVIDSERTDFQPLQRGAVRDIGADLRLLDGYVFARPDIFGHPFDVRVGNQALNWGESTFIGGGINTITPVDATALRAPGSELRQAFLPIPVIDVKTEIMPDTTLEAYYQFTFVRDKLEPAGSFFGTNDTLVDGGLYANLRSDVADNTRASYAASLASGILFGAAYPRSDSRYPTTKDEFGFALRKNFSSLGDTEIGLYYENFDSRQPFASFRTGKANVSGLPGPLSVAPFPFSALEGPGIQYATRTYDSTSSIFADFPTDIHLIGVSWNFTGPAGLAVQGELSSRINQPIQLAGADLSFATDGPAIRKAAGLGIPALVSANQQLKEDPVVQATGENIGFGSVIDGWKRYPVIQAQTTFTKLFAAIPSLKINSVAIVGEIGADYVANFPRNRGLFNAPYTTDTESAFVTGATVDSGTVYPLSKKGLASQFSAAYTVAVVLDMPNVLPYAIDMKPLFALQHDFVGTSPGGVNTFVENTAAASVGVSFSYLQAYSLGVQYTNHFPVFSDGKYDGLLDRDFFSAVLSYEF